MTKPKDPEVTKEMSPPPESAANDAEKASTSDEAEAATEETFVAEAAEDEVADTRAETEEAHQPAELEHQIDEHAEEHGHRSLAATALMILVGALAVAAGTLWAAPKVAPHLPAGIAQYLMPGQLDTAAEITALKTAITETTGKNSERIATLEERLSAAEAAAQEAIGRLDALPDLDTLTSRARQALELAQQAGAAVEALEREADAAETEMIGLRERLAAIDDALAAGDAAGEGPVSSEVSAALMSLKSRLDTIASGVANRSELAALQDTMESLQDRIDALAASTEDVRNVQSQALGEVSSAIQQASLRSAVAALSSQLVGGQPFATPLAEVTALTGSEPPQDLAEHSETGLSTSAQLGASFGPFAQAAIAADVQVRSGEGTGSQVLGWLRAQVTGRPITEQEGNSVGAITSRIAARVGEGALAAALSEAEALPPHSQAAMDDWLSRLRARVGAETALTAWLAEIGVNG